MGKQNAKIFYWEDYMSRLENNSNSVDIDGTAHGGGGGGGFGKTPGQRLRKQISHTYSTFQWLLENVKDSEWEKATTKREGGIAFNPQSMIYAINSSREKKRATPAQKLELRRIIFAFHDPMMAEYRLKEALNDPLWELHNYKQLFKLMNMPFPPDNETM